MAEKTALVLSAGGMFGAYQAGVWSELSSRFQPDMVIGTSVGALNGWAIAGGCPADELVRHWSDPAVAGFLRWRVRPWRGFLDSASFEAHVQRLHASYTPRLPVGVVLTDLVRLRSRLVQSGEITWKHLAAACTIPFALPPVEIEGRWYVDGGLLNVLPLWAAAEMGATRAVAINALPLLPSRVLRSLVRTVRWFSRERLLAGELHVTLISPRVPLGGLRDSIRWDRRRVERWVELGAEDARSITISLSCPPIGSTA